jgi:outer membrane protein TolC
MQIRVRRSVFAFIAVLGTVYPKAFAAEGDPFAGVSQVTPANLVEAVLARNPTLPAMQAAWEASKSRIEQASALDDPMLSYGLAPGAAHSLGFERGQIVELSQALPWPGKRQLRGDAAQYEADAAREDIAQTRLKLIAAAKGAFADWSYIHEAIRINRVNQGLLREFEAIAELKYSTGRASKQDALRAEVERNLLEHQAIVLERKRREVLTHLNTLLNCPPDRPVPPPAALGQPERLPAAERLRMAAVAARPELAALTAKIRAQQARVDGAELNFYPDFRVAAGYEGRWDEEEQRYSVGVGINIPLDQDKRHAAVDEANAARMQAEWEQQAKAVEIAGEVQRAYDRVEESRHILALYREKLLPKADENLQAAKADYESGAGDFLALVTAEKNLLETQLTAIRVLADYHRRLALLESSVGGAEHLSAADKPQEVKGHD